MTKVLLVNGSPHKSGCTHEALSVVVVRALEEGNVGSDEYWIGNTPDEVRRDAEGLQIMRVLGRNMAWLLKLKDLGEQAGVPLPEQEDSRLATNFIE